jgi:hypothetical protein
MNEKTITGVGAKFEVGERERKKRSWMRHLLRVKVTRHLITLRVPRSFKHRPRRWYLVAR